MLTKLIESNQVILPDSVVQAIGPVEYFEVTVESGHIILKPIAVRADAVRQKLAELNISDQDITNAVAWARQNAPHE